jgi:hypothetical protein
MGYFPKTSSVFSHGAHPRTAPQRRIFSQIGWTNQVRFETVIALRNQAQTPSGVLKKAGLPLPASHLTPTKYVRELFI